MPHRLDTGEKVHRNRMLPRSIASESASACALGGTGGQSVLTGREATIIADQGIPLTSADAQSLHFDSWANVVRLHHGATTHICRPVGRGPP